MVYQPENLENRPKISFGQFWGALWELGGTIPPASKNHDFCNANLSDGSETFGIDSTGE